MLRCEARSEYYCGIPTSHTARRASLPKANYKEQQKKCEAEGAPVDKSLRGAKKAGRRNERSPDKINKVTRTPFRCVGQALAVQNCGCDQDDAKSDRSKMKLDDARYVVSRILVVRD